MAAKSRFSLSRASADDLAETATLEYKCFPEHIRQTFMGCKSEADLPRLVEMYADAMRRDHHDIWVKVVDREKGNIVAASNWKVYPSGAPESAGDHPPAWLEGEDLDRTRGMTAAMNEARNRANPGGFIHLHILFSDPDYRRQGAAGLMMRWGCDLADLLFLPAWVESSPEGNYLYRKYGFYDFEVAAGGLEGTNMKRDARKSVIDGGSEAKLGLAAEAGCSC